MSFYKNFKSSEKFVAMVLKESEGTRGDDKKLMLEVWKRQGLVLTPYQEQMFMRVMTPETITRCRRKIQEYGFFRPSPERYQQRQLLADEMRENA